MQIDSALPIVRALADGVNPITGEAFPDTSPYAEPRTLRALFTAVDLLEREALREQKRSRLPANFGKPWTDAEDAKAAAAYERGEGLAHIATALYRTQSSVKLRLEKLGKIKPE